MIARTLLILAWAAGATAAEDLIIMHDGVKIRGEVVGDDGRDVVLLIGNGRTATFERGRIAEIVRGGGGRQDMVLDPRTGRWLPADPEPARDPAALHWTASLLCTAGWSSGSADSTGSVLDTLAANRFAIDGSFDLGGGQFPAGAALRLTRDAAPAGAGWRLGVQGGWAQSSSDEAACTDLQLAGLLGWSWGGTQRRHAVQVLAGWCRGSLDRDLVLRDGTGTYLGTVEDSADLDGFTLAFEAETSWLVGRWALGLLAGASWTSLSGDTSWSVAGGNYLGEESFDATPITIYAGGFIGLRL